MSDSWPADAPETLWHYRRLQIQEMPQIPMMGVHFADRFLIAFAVGLLFIAYFAWDRFNTRQSSGLDFRYRVMKEIDVADLGGAAALRQAYFIYLVTLLFLYVAMTFFGKLVVQTLNELRVVGIQVDSSSLQFDSPQWPLMLAFGFAGLAPLIPQLRMAEEWLFQRAYRAVGIPVRINETTRNLLSILDAASAGDLTKAQSLVDELGRRTENLKKTTEATWLHESLNASKLENGLSLLAQLELLLSWAKGRRGAWPGSEVSDSVRYLEQTIANQADELLDGFERRIREPASSGEAKTVRREKYIVDTYARAQELRDEMTAILAVYVERDPTLGGSPGDPNRPVRAPELRELLEKADPPNLAGTGPETGMLICVLLTIPIYAVFTWQELHTPLTPRATPDSPSVILATAGISALLLLSIFWLPLLVAFAIRQHYYDEGKWIPGASHDRSAYAKQRLSVLASAVVVSFICLSGVAALWAFLIARDVSGFQALFVGGSNPFLLYGASMALIAIPLVWLTLRSADARLDDQKALWYGMLSALVVSICQSAHLAFWYDAQGCMEDATFLTDLFAAGCFTHYNGLDFLVMPALAFLAAVVFGNPPPASLVLQRRRSIQRGVARTAVILALTLTSISVYLPMAMAQEAPIKPEVKVGFRADIEPFSYKISVDGGKRDGLQPLYRGFLADLCYWIFDGGDYSVREIDVTALDRFDKLTRGDIDVLCDPVTMRFSDKVDPVTMRLRKAERIESGVFSPILFATGISYLQRRNRSLGSPVYIGYVEGTTAEDVLGGLCKVDLFGVIPADERSELATMCQTASMTRRIALMDFCDIDLGKVVFGDEGDRLAIVCQTRFADRESAARQIMHTDWYNRLLNDLKRVASDEAAVIMQRSNKASGSKKAQLMETLRAWNDTVDKINACQKAENDCTRDWILDRLGNSCDALDQTPADEPDGKQANGSWKRTTYRYCSFKNHRDLISWFCKPHSENNIVYLGDREIILGKLQTWNDGHDAKCVVEDENGAGDLTYEPYAIMVRKPKSFQEVERMQNIAELVQRRVYEFFSFSSLARAKFDTYFLGLRKDRTMSTALAYLFLLNGIEDERLFAFPIPEEGTAAGVQ
ncbi:hypothetical protein V7796_15095 [Rhizobium laguerreae]